MAHQQRVAPLEHEAVHGQVRQAEWSVHAERRVRLQQVIRQRATIASIGEVGEWEGDDAERYPRCALAS